MANKWRLFSVHVEPGGSVRPAKSPYSNLVGESYEVDDKRYTVEGVSPSKPMTGQWLVVRNHGDNASFVIHGSVIREVLMRTAREPEVKR